MPAKPWADDKGLEWLESRIPDFLAARQAGQTNEWYPRIYHEWFEEFPNPEPSAAAIAKWGSASNAVETEAAAIRKKIYWWFQNHNRGTGTNGGSRVKVLKLNQRRRRLQPVHAYMHLHKEKISPIITKRWTDYLAARPEGEAIEQWIAFYPRVARELLAEESEEVKAAVEQYRKSPSAGVDEIPAEPGSETNEQRKVKDTQRCIEGLSRTIKLACDSIREQTGWIGTVFLGGPDPRSGAYSSLIYHSGTTIAAGSRWDQSCNKWADIEKSFGDFVPKCYPPNLLEQLSQTYRSCYSRDATPDGNTGSKGNATEDVTTGAEPSDRPANSPEAAATTALSSTVSPPAVPQPPLPATSSPEPTASTQPPLPALSSPEPTASTQLPPHKDNQFEAEREETIRRNREMLQQLGLTGGSPTKPTSQSNRRPRSRAKPTSASAPTSRALRPREKENAPQGSAAEQGPLSTSPEHNVDGADASIETELPDWMKTALDHLRPLSDDRRWRGMLESWVLHETELGFPTGQGSATRLSKTARPEEVDWWLRIGRRDYSKQPEIKDVPQYSAQWKQWWVSLQPDWRGSTWPLPRPDDADGQNWDVLRRGGCNAIFLVIVALSWWYGNALASGNGDSEALLAVDDVEFVLTSMQPKTGRKRQHEAEEQPSNKRQSVSPN